MDVFFACMAGAIVSVIVLNPTVFQLNLADASQTIVNLIGNNLHADFGFVVFLEWFDFVSMDLWIFNIGVRLISIAHARRKSWS